MFRTLALSLMIPAALWAAASSFSTMSVDEVSVLLNAASAKEAVSQGSAVKAGSENSSINLTAQDMVMKVYGVLDNCNSMEDCMADAQRLSLNPATEEDILWLESDGGYNVSYYGRTPEVSALARFGNGTDAPVSDYGYFFLFPYEAASHGESTADQVDFTSVLLQEIHDMGIPMALREDTSDALFDATGDYKGNLVDVRLLDDRKADGAGRYILVLSIEPGAYSAFDNDLAEEVTIRP